MVTRILQYPFITTELYAMNYTYCLISLLKECQFSHPSIEKLQLQVPMNVTRTHSLLSWELELYTFAFSWCHTMEWAVYQTTGDLGSEDEAAAAEQPFAYQLSFATDNKLHYDEQLLVAVL